MFTILKKFVIINTNDNYFYLQIKFCHSVQSLSQSGLGKNPTPTHRRKIAMTMTIARYFSNREANRLPTLHSQNLFALTKEVRIEHQGEEYRLRLTRNNRLILTK